jgi:hypothetical protein
VPLVGPLPAVTEPVGDAVEDGSVLGRPDRAEILAPPIGWVPGCAVRRRCPLDRAPVQCVHLCASAGGRRPEDQDITRRWAGEHIPTVFGGVETARHRVWWLDESDSGGVPDEQSGDEDNAGDLPDPAAPGPDPPPAGAQPILSPLVSAVVFDPAIALQGRWPRHESAEDRGDLYLRNRCSHPVPDTGREEGK